MQRLVERGIGLAEADMRKLEVEAPLAAVVALRREFRLSPASRFAHRLHCVCMVAAGQSCYAVAALYGDHPRSVERWVVDFKKGGVDALRDKPHRGRQASLTAAQTVELGEFVRSGEAGTPPRSTLLQAEIRRRFGVLFSLRHCRRLGGALQAQLPPAC